ncbi:MAG: hypothetical protein ACRC1K_23300 [Planctomycetia bacterium]
MVAAAVEYITDGAFLTKLVKRLRQETKGMTETLDADGLISPLTTLARAEARLKLIESRSS